MKCYNCGSNQIFWFELYVSKSFIPVTIKNIRWYKYNYGVKIILTYVFINIFKTSSMKQTSIQKEYGFKARSPLSNNSKNALH